MEPKEGEGDVFVTLEADELPGFLVLQQFAQQRVVERVTGFMGLKRADGEVLGLLRKGLAKAARTTTIAEIHGEFPAIDSALASLKPGDLCLILIDQVDEALAHIAKRVAET